MIMFAVRPIYAQDAIFKMSSVSPLYQLQCLALFIALNHVIGYQNSSFSTTQSCNSMAQ